MSTEPREADAGTKKDSRRCFILDSLAASAGFAVGMSLEDRALLAKEAKTGGGAKTAPPTGPQPLLPTGTIGGLTMTRLILGGNLILGFAHSRELVYVSSLLKKYYTDEKVLETLHLAEQLGINTVNTNPKGTRVIQRYWKECNGRIQWIVQDYSSEYGRYDSIRASVDNGASAIYMQGNVTDRLIKAGQVDKIAKVVAEIKRHGVYAGVAGHALDVHLACEKADVGADFYVKTLHSNDYFSAWRPEQGVEVTGCKDDNFWCVHPEKVIEAMATIKTPWIAYKVMAAGAIPPKKAFQYAFDNGADFVLAGIFDFQMAEDVQIAREVLADVKRTRPWRA